MPRHCFRAFGAGFAVLLALSLLAAAACEGIGEDFSRMEAVLPLSAILSTAALAALLSRGGNFLSANSPLPGFASHPRQAPPFF